MANILVTGVGAVIGYGIVRSIKDSTDEHRVIGIDIYADAVGQKWCDAFEQSILVADPGYEEFLNEVIDRYEIDLIIPGIEQDVSWLSENREVLSVKTKLALNNSDLIAVCRDKWTLHEALQKNGFEVIPTKIEGSWQECSDLLGVPMILKPRRSYAAKGIQILETEEDFCYWKAKLRNEFMVQKIVGDVDSEYTASGFGFGDGEISEPIIFKRYLNREGATVRARTEKNEAIKEKVIELSNILKPLGPTNFQFRVEDDQVFLLEINPRFSSTTSLKTAFGFNEAMMTIDFYLNEKKPEPYVIQEGIAARHLEDVIYYDSHSR